MVDSRTHTVLADEDGSNEICEAVRQFVEVEVVPLEREHGPLLSDPRRLFTSDGRFSGELLGLRELVRKKSAEAGFYTMLAPESLGGGGLGPVAAVRILESLYEHAGPGRVLLQDLVIPSPFTNGLSPVLEHLPDAIREKYLPGLGSGTKTLAFALSEPDAGSDVYAIRTRARLDGSRWRITGSKQWITNGPYADHIVVFAVTDKRAAANRQGGITAFFVNREQEGFNQAGVIPIMGAIGGELGILTFDEVAVERDHVLGDVDRGFEIAMSGIGYGRLGMAASLVGHARWALRLAVEYANNRVAFGSPLAQHQGIAFQLADMAMDIYATKSAVLRTAQMRENGSAAIKEIAIAKALSTEMAFRVMDKAIAVLGAIGLTNEVRLEAGLRYARAMRVPDGTSEILRRTVARQLARGDLAL